MWIVCFNIIPKQNETCIKQIEVLLFEKTLGGIKPASQCIV